MATDIHSSSPQDSNIRLSFGSNNSRTPKSPNSHGMVASSSSLSDKSRAGSAGGGSSNYTLDGDDENENEDEDEDEDDFRIKSIGDQNPHLMAYLENSDSDNSNAIASTSEDEDESNDNGNDDDNEAEAEADDDDADLDESAIEAEEEQAIRAELKLKGRQQSIPGPVSLRRLSQSQHTRNENGADSDDSDAQSEGSSSGDDLLEDYFDLPANLQGGGVSVNGFDAQFTEGTGADVNVDGDNNNGLDSNENDSAGDDSYLWQYFFSSDENEPSRAVDDPFSFSNPTSRARERRLSRSRKLQASSQKLSATDFDDGGSTDDDLPLKGKGPLPASQIAGVQPAGYVPSGDSTDEDDGVPPERKKRRAKGTKAIEVLGANSFSTRPPVLGSWRIKGDKNIGIIDGLTTRTLSPPPSQAPAKQQHQHPHQHQQHQQHQHQQHQQQQHHLRQHQHQHQQHHLPVASGRRDSIFEDSGDISHTEEPRDPFEGIDANDISIAGLGDFTDFGASEYNESPNHVGNAQIDDSQFDGEVSDLDLLELGDFINTETLSSGDENEGAFEFDLIFDPQQQQLQQQQQQQQQQHSQSAKQFRSPAISPYLYRNRMSNRNVPISAFRNRGSPYVSNPAYPTENPSPVPRRPRRNSLRLRRPSHNREAIPSPGSAKKRVKRLKSGTKGLLESQNEQQPNGEYDFIGELIEIGAISPMFDIDN